tara:strand:+ start:6472 stop:7383 length:912 start_codon:yes stop_codon:yes gene_type:complete
MNTAGYSPDIKKVTTAIIPVAGLGTRMLPATKAIPKELLPIIDKPIIQYVVEEAIGAGIKEFIFITRSGKEAIENHFDSNYELEKKLEFDGKRNILKLIKNITSSDISISSIRQENPNGLGHAILCAKNIINKRPFAILLPDEIIKTRSKNSDFSSMMRLFKKSGKGQILVKKIPKKDISNYGVVEMNSKFLNSKNSRGIKNLIEKPTAENSPSNYRIVGRYILPYEVMKFLKTSSKKIKSEIELTDAIQSYNLNFKDKLEAYISESEIFDCGNPRGFLSANISFAMDKPDMRRHLKNIINSN